MVAIKLKTLGESLKKKPWASSLRIIIPLYFTYLLFVLSILLVFIPNEKQHMLDQKKIMIRELTQNVWSLLAEYDNRVHQGELTLEDAWQRAINRIRHLRYGPEGKDYFWINDMHPRMIMHPYFKDLEGEDLTTFKDINGQFLFVSTVMMLQNQESGYLNYMWQWKDDPGQIVPKISFVKKFSPWNWVIGTGVYVEDIQREIRVVLHNFIKIFTGILAIVVILSAHISRQTFRIEKKRKISEDSLRKSEERYRLLADNATDNIWVVQLSDLTYSYMSPSVEQVLGYSSEEYIGLKLGAHIKESSAAEIYEILSEELKRDGQEGVDPKRYRTIVLQLIKKDGEKIWAEITARFLRDKTGKPDRILGITRDISQRKYLEEKLQQAHKMEALGTLSGGIAHDFNNILSSIVGFTELAKLGCSRDEEEIRENLDQVLAASMRARDLVRHILTFSRRADVHKELLHITPLIRESLKFFRASTPTNIHIQHHLEASSGIVLADATQIHQILMNLFTNAAHAMGKRGGTLDVRLKHIEIQEGGLSQVNQLIPGPYLQLTVADTGCGISKEVMTRIFEPFFTTKGRGEGTGMGLSIAYGIIKEMGGAISVYSEADMGTTFQVLLPEHHVTLKTGENPDNLLLLSGKGRILLVDDEASIVDWSRQLLFRLGYEVDSTTESLEAIHKFKQRPNDYDLVLTDMTMPHMNGLELANQIRELRPDIPIILCTGFSEGLTSEIINDSGIFEMIMKPMIAGDLARTVGRAINRGMDGALL